MRAWRLPVGVTRRRGDDARKGAERAGWRLQAVVSGRICNSGRNARMQRLQPHPTACAANAPGLRHSGCMSAGPAQVRMVRNPPFIGKSACFPDRWPIFTACVVSAGKSRKHLTTEAGPTRGPDTIRARCAGTEPSDDAPSITSNGTKSARGLTIIIFADDGAGVERSIATSGDAVFPRSSIQREGRVS